MNHLEGLQLVRDMLGRPEVGHEAEPSPQAPWYPSRVEVESERPRTAVDVDARVLKPEGFPEGPCHRSGAVHPTVDALSNRSRKWWRRYPERLAGSLDPLRVAQEAIAQLLRADLDHPAGREVPGFP